MLYRRELPGVVHKRCLLKEEREMANGDARKTLAVNVCAVMVVTLSLALASLVSPDAALAGTWIALPKTGQIASYAEGDDGKIQAGVKWPSPRFTDNGDGTITDSLTGLMWLKDANCFGKMRWQDGLNAVASFNSNPWDYDCQDYTTDYTDWRLPNINELESLVNAGATVNAAWLTENGFVHVQPDYYWSSTTMAKVGDVSHAYVVGMWGGNTHVFNKKPDTMYILPVRAGGSLTFGSPRTLVAQTGQFTSYKPGDDGALQAGIVWPSPRFEDNKDGTVTDNLTGLMWLKDANCLGRGRWDSILSRVGTLNANPAGCGCSEYAAGYTDWRLPNRRELVSLLDRGQFAPVLPLENPFINVQLGNYWSSTSHKNGYPAAVGMNNGYVLTSMYKSQSYYGWPVRTGEVVMDISIDIKPGSDSNPINRNNKGKVPVAILGSPDFDVADVDATTVVFAGSAMCVLESVEDVNDDGVPDLVLHFNTQDLSLEISDTQACLSGETFGGQGFEGCDRVRVIDNGEDRGKGKN